MTTQNAMVRKLPTGTSMSKPKALRAILEKSGVTIAPEAWCTRAALMAQNRGFEAIFVGGNMIAGLHHVLQDYGLVTMTEILDFAGRVAEAVEIPVVVDMDQGGDNPLQVYRNVKTAQKRDIAGITIEDTMNPKHMGGPTDALIPIEVMVGRIKAAVEAKVDKDFVVIARSDELLRIGQPGFKGSVDEIIRRGVAFREAGADAYFPITLPSDQMDRVAREVGLPLVDTASPYSEVRDTPLRLMLMSHTFNPILAMFDELLIELQNTGGFEFEENKLFPNTYRTGPGGSKGVGEGQIVLLDSGPAIRNYGEIEKYRRLAKEWLETLAKKP